MTAPSNPKESHWLVRAARAAAPTESSGRIPSVLPPDLPGLWRLVTKAAGVGNAALVLAAATELAVPVADLTRVERGAVRLLSERVARRYGVLPLGVTEATMRIATADPLDLAALADLEFACGRAVQFELAHPDDLAAAIDGEYSPEHAIDSVVKGLTPGEATVVLADDLATVPDAAALEDPTGAVRRLAATLLRDAVVQGASDIHLALVGSQGVVRYRIDGTMRQMLTMPGPVHARVVSRLKVIGGLDVSDHRRPQDGRSRVVVDGVGVDLRLSTLPLEGGGERLVIRILQHQTIATLDSLDLVEPERTQLLALMGGADGMVVMTGPTGSGKTTTLHAALKQRLSPEVTIMTVENPVEYRIAGISQVQVEPKAGLTFASALRAMLRQDPDIVLVGEIRDTETAETAAQAAMTGHLVLTTVHADDAPGALLRMRDLGLELDTLAESFRGAAAQRLLRKLCPACRTAPDPNALSETEQEFARLTGQMPAGRAVGCEACGFRGYKGRLPIHQVFTFTDALRHLVQAGAETERIRQVARDGGMRTLGEAAATRIERGETTVDEAVRVLGTRFWDELRGVQPAAGAEPVVEVDSALEEAALAAKAMADLAAPTRILVFSTDASVREALQSACAETGAEVVTAAWPAEAGRVAVRTAGIRMLVLHLGVSDQSQESEVELLNDLRRALGELTLPVLLVLPEGNALLPKAMAEKGVDDYLTMPLSPGAVAKRVRAVLRRSVEQRALLDEATA